MHVTTKTAPTSATPGIASKGFSVGENQRLPDRLVRAKFNQGYLIFGAAVDHEKLAVINHLRNAATLAASRLRTRCTYRRHNDLHPEYRALTSARDSLYFERFVFCYPGEGAGLPWRYTEAISRP
jgi:hypothetical protein